MEEAEHLADTIIVLDAGHIAASGTSDQLKDQLGGNVLEVRVHRPGRPRPSGLDDRGPGQRVASDKSRPQSSVLPVTDGARVLIAAGRALDDEGIALDDLGIRRPSLDDVFLGDHRTLGQFEDTKPTEYGKYP